MGIYSQTYAFDDGPYTFQVLIAADGSIHTRYLEMNSRVNNYCFGIQNQSRNTGLTIRYVRPQDPEQYTFSGTAVRIAPPVTWMDITPVTGYLSEEETETISLTVDATDLDVGRYEARLTVESATTGQAFTIPVDLEVGDVGNQMVLPIQENYFELVSTYLMPANLNAASVFGGINGLSIVYQNDGFVFIPPNLNTIGQISLNQGYRIFSTQTSQWVVEGEPVNPDLEFQLNGNTWNWVGYPFDHPVPIADAMEQIVDDVEIVLADDGSFWIPPNINTIGSLDPGTGYMVYLLEPTTFQYQDNAAAGLQRAPVTLEMTDLKDAPAKTGLPYIVLVSFDDMSIEMQPAIIEVYDGNLLVGKGLVQEDSDVSPVITWQGDSSRELAGFTAGNRMQVVVRDPQGNKLPLSMNGNQSFGDGAYATVSFSGETLPREFRVEQGYPNPFNPSVTVPFALPIAGNISFTLYNLLGQRVFDSTMRKEAGYHRFVFDVSNQQSELVSGMYFLQVSYEGKLQTQKLMLLK